MIVDICLPISGDSRCNALLSRPLILERGRRVSAQLRWPPMRPPRPPYAPDLNPAEMVWDHTKYADLASFMTRTRHLAPSAHDAGLGEFQHLLAYKAGEAGVPVVTVNASHTSPACSRCGARVKKSLSVRVHSGPHCGLERNRGVNAARHALTRALNAARTERSGPNVDPWVGRALRSHCLHLCRTTGAVQAVG